MKTLILTATLACSALSFSAPMQAATSAPAMSIEQMLTGTADRQGRNGCDTPRDIKEHPRCTKPA